MCLPSQSSGLQEPVPMSTWLVSSLSRLSLGSSSHVFVITPTLLCLLYTHILDWLWSQHRLDFSTVSQDNLRHRASLLTKIGLQNHTQFSATHANESLSRLWTVEACLSAAGMMPSNLSCYLWCQTLLYSRCWPYYWVDCLLVGNINTMSICSLGQTWHNHLHYLHGSFVNHLHFNVFVRPHEGRRFLLKALRLLSWVEIE